jgi:hypothetical protein
MFNANNLLNTFHPPINLKYKLFWKKKINNLICCIGSTVVTKQKVLSCVQVMIDRFWMDN